MECGFCHFVNHSTGKCTCIAYNGISQEVKRCFSRIFKCSTEDFFASLHLAFVCAFLAVAYQKTYFFVVETIHNHHILLFYFILEVGPWHDDKCLPPRTTSQEFKN